MHGDSRCADQQHDIIYRTSTGDGIEAIGCMTCEETNMTTDYCAPCNDGEHASVEEGICLCCAAAVFEED